MYASAGFPAAAGNRVHFRGQNQLAAIGIRESPGHSPSYHIRFAPARLAKSDRLLVVGTEITVDQSKPVSAYVQGMLQRAGLDVPERLSSFQVQHGCTGATIGGTAPATSTTASVDLQRSVPVLR